MSERARISAMAGIAAGEDEPQAFWPLNIVLLVLGAAVLGVAFYFLDPRDERILYNPWTYTVATPIVLLLLSMLLSTLVSRLIEKSMQLAFLLSVLVHLALLVWAVNVVIYSRMWPDLLDSLAMQREQLERQSLQAKQYVRASSTTQAGRRPDYLQPVPTQHQPTEIEQAISPTLALARSERANLASPSPKIELSTVPHLMERDRPATSLPTISPEAAPLSKSQMPLQIQPSAARADMPSTAALETSSPTALAPTPASLKRSSENDRRQPETTSFMPAPSTPTSALASRSSSLPRATPQALDSPLASTTAEAIPRRRGASISSPRPSAAPSIEASSLAETTQRLALQASASAAIASERRRNADVGEVVRQPTALTPTDSIRPKLDLPRTLPRAAERQFPIPSAGDIATRLQKDTAGGRAGPAAPTSLPVQGIENMAAASQAQDLELRSAPLTEMRRNAASQRVPSLLPEPGAPQGLTWNGVPRLSGGVAGRSPLQLAQSATQDGDAASNDVAGLIGAGRAIERSSLDLAGPQGDLKIPASVDVPTPTLAGESDASGGSAASGRPSLAATRAEINRSRSPGAAMTTTGTIGETSEPQDASDRMASLFSRGLSRAAGARGTGLESLSPAKLDPAASSNNNLPRRQAEVDTEPGLERISVDGLAASSDDLPQESDFGSADVAGSLTPLARSDPESTGTASLSTPLDLEQLEGPGGVSPNLDVSGPMLARRDDILPRAPLQPQIDSQRFARQSVGGRLAAGQTIPIPRAAFQQRLDRLNDRQAQDESAMEPQTELAIERGLEFLAKHQRPDGSWRLQDFDTDVLMRSDTAATALALLAFQGAGYTHLQFKYATTVDRALEFLIERQHASGDLYIRQDPASDQNAWLYSHGIAALALCEAFGMTQDEKLRSAAQRAVDFMVASQDPRRGGWRYRPGSGSDTSVTGWFMMAFKSGQLAGLNVPQESFQKIERYLEASQASTAASHLYRYNPFAADTPQQRHGLEPTAVMTSVGLLMRLYTGWTRERAEMIKGTDVLLQRLPEHGSRAYSKRDTYYWYYATQVMFHMRGERWEKWHNQLYPLLINNQVIEGEQAGSWDPTYPTPDLWARYGGRLYVTTMNLLSLEVSYRHLPLYEATAQ